MTFMIAWSVERAHFRVTIFRFPRNQCRSGRGASRSWTDGYSQPSADEGRKKFLKKHGIEVGDTLSFEQFFSVAQRLKAAGLVPLAMGDAGLWTGDRLRRVYDLKQAVSLRAPVP